MNFLLAIDPGSSEMPAGSPILSFWEKQPPLAAAACAAFADQAIERRPNAKGDKDTVISLDLGVERLIGTPLIMRYLARSGKGPAIGLYGSGDALSATQIDYWIDYAASASAGPNFEAVCNGINEYMTLRTFLVGYCLTVADLALWGQLQSEWNTDHGTLAGAQYRFHACFS